MKYLICYFRAYNLNMTRVDVFSDHWLSSQVHRLVAKIRTSVQWGGPAENFSENVHIGPGFSQSRQLRNFQKASPQP